MQGNCVYSWKVMVILQPRDRMCLEPQSVWSWFGEWELGQKESVSPPKVSGLLRNHSAACTGDGVEGDGTKIINEAESFERKNVTLLPSLCNQIPSSSLYSFPAFCCFLLGTYIYNPKLICSLTCLWSFSPIRPYTSSGGDSVWLANTVCISST